MNVTKFFIKPLLLSKTPVYTGRRNRADPCKKFVRVNHCIFDLDGVILENHQPLDNAYKAVFQKYGQEYTAEWRQTIMGMSKKAMWQKVIKELKLNTSWEKMYEYYLYTLKDSLLNAPLRPGVEKLVSHLAENRVPLALVTSFEKDTMAANTSHVQELISKFNIVVCAGDDPQITESKPNRLIYLATSLRFSGKPDGETCLVFEDTRNGVMAARAACMQVIGIPCSPTTARSLRHADDVINTLNDFRPAKYGLPAYKELKDSMS